MGAIFNLNHLKTNYVVCPVNAHYAPFNNLGNRTLATCDISYPTKEMWKHCFDIP